MGNQMFTFRSLMAFLLVTVHASALAAYLYLSVVRCKRDGEIVHQGPAYPATWDYSHLILYIGYGVLNSVFGIITGIVLLLKPKEHYKDFLQIWLWFSLIILLTTFALLTFVEVPMHERILMLLVTLTLYAGAFAEAVTANYDPAESLEEEGVTNNDVDTEEEDFLDEHLEHLQVFQGEIQPSQKEGKL